MLFINSDDWNFQVPYRMLKLWMSDGTTWETGPVNSTCLVTKETEYEVTMTTWRGGYRPEGTGTNLWLAEVT